MFFLRNEDAVISGHHPTFRSAHPHDTSRPLMMAVLDMYEYMHIINITRLVSDATPLRSKHNANRATDQQMQGYLAILTGVLFECKALV